MGWFWHAFLGWKHAPVLSAPMVLVSHLKYMVPSQSEFTQVQAKMHSAKPGNPALQSKQTVWVIVHLHNFFEIQWRTPYINFRGFRKHTYFCDLPWCFTTTTTSASCFFSGKPIAKNNLSDLTSQSESGIPGLSQACPKLCQDGWHQCLMNVFLLIVAISVSCRVSG